MDPLAEVLRISRVHGALLARVVATHPWGIALSATSGVAMHAVMAGSCWLRVAGSAPRQLMRGDIVILPAGTEHVVASAPRGSTVSFDRLAKQRMLTSAGDLELNSGGDGMCTRFLCAGYDFDHRVAHRLIAMLPAVVHVAASDPDDGLQATLQMLGRELRSEAPGSSTTIDRLIDVLFVHILRAWIDDDTHRAASWLSALTDPTVADALAQIHAHPNQAWTLTSLARAVGVSRATLARRFTDRVGEPPMQYLTTWRMDVAAHALRETSHSIDRIAREVGYTSEFAFSRAFARSIGQPPGRYRKSIADDSDALSSSGT